MNTPGGGAGSVPSTGAAKPMASSQGNNAGLALMQAIAGRRPPAAAPVAQAAPLMAPAAAASTNPFDSMYSSGPITPP